MDSSLQEAAQKYLINGLKRKELLDEKKRVRDTLAKMEDSFQGFYKKPRNEETQVERTKTLCRLRQELNAIEEQHRKCHIELATIKQKYITSPQEPRYQTKKHIDSEIERNGYTKNNRFSSFFRTLDPNNKLVQYRNNLPLERSIFNIPPSTLPLALRFDATTLSLPTGPVLVDIWQYILDKGFIKERSVLYALRVLSVSFAIIVNSSNPIILGYHFVL